MRRFRFNPREEEGAEPESHLGHKPRNPGAATPREEVRGRRLSDRLREEGEPSENFWRCNAPLLLRHPQGGGEGCRLSDRPEGGGNGPFVSHRGYCPELKSVDIREEG